MAQDGLPPALFGARPGIGVDVASVARVAAAVARSSRLRDRVFTAGEQRDCRGRPERWAARWAAKEAVRKLAGCAGVMPLPAWRDIEVRRGPDGAPRLHYRDAESGLVLSLSHEGNLAVAVVAALPQALVGSSSPAPLQGRPSGMSGAPADPHRPPQAPPTGDLRLAPRPDDGNKGTFGTVVVVAGSHGFSGAAYLSATGAARGGAGRVRLCVPAALHLVMAAKCVEVMPFSVPDGGRGVIGPEAVAVIRNRHLPAAQALVIGPGLGLDEDTEAALLNLLTGLPCAAVVDADGLTIAARAGLDWRAAGQPVVLTPHPAEMGRLCGRSAGEVQADRHGVAVSYARERGVTVVLKGAATLVAGADGRVCEAPFRLAALATAGTGDVLAGLLGAMLAAGLPAFDAAVAAVWIHGEAGMALEAERGRAGALAGDLLEHLPAAQERLRRALERASYGAEPRAAGLRGDQPA